MKVLHVTPTMSAEAGGPPVAVRGLTTALTARAIECEVLTTRGGRFLRPPLSIPGVPVHALTASPFSAAWNAHSPALGRFVEDRLAEYDLVHVHELWHYPGFVACRAARKRGIPYLLSLRGGLDDLALRQKAARKWLYMKMVQRPILRSASALHALTTVEAALCRQLQLQTRVPVIPNGVAADLSETIDQLDVSAFLERFPMLGGKRVILFLGRLSANKGLDLLARSFIDVAKQFDDAALLIVGPNEGNTRSQVTLLLESAGLIERVAFTGALDGLDKLSALACADVFVLPSYAEGFSNAVLEALAAGLPVVISEHCNFPEVAECKAGFVVRNDVAEIGNAICGLLGDDHRRQEAGRNGRRMVEERYCWPMVAAAFADLYGSIVASG